MSYSIFKELKQLSVMVLCVGLLGACASTQSAQDQSKSGGLSSPESENGIKPYSEVVTDKAETDSGLFDVHKVDKDYLYEIPDSLLSREMLLVSRVAETQDEIGYGGEKLNTQVVRWQKKDDQVLLRHVSYENVASDSLPVYEAVQNSNFEPIIASFDVKSLGEDSSGVVIDVTKLYDSDIPSLGLQSSQREEYGVRRLDPERSFIEHINSYPENIEARSWMTYDASKPPSSSSTGTISMEINHSMVLLPEEKWETRSYDQRIGYFSVQQTDYGTERHKANEVQYITRYKLVPSDKEAYLDGELVEPKEPIVYYIDPATPKEWRPYLKQGVEDWQKAFEAAGFKNAIIAKDPPSKEENPEWSPEDVRYSVIRYFASDIQNAYGPHVHDPRTGQILESDIGWYHNVMNLLRNWYFVQTAAANPDARAVQFKDEVMGELIRFVSAHEVGHTIGLPHNYGSSYAYPVDSLRSPIFTEKHGTAPSIMDYARFNYIAQPGDGVEDFHPAVGEYDKWSIKWGYTWFPEDMSEEEKVAKLNEWTRERADDPRYFYGQQTGNKIDPRSQNEDLGNDAMKASELGIANLKRITSNLVEWTDREGENFAELEELYNNVVGQWNRYMGHVTKNVGGVYEDHKTYNQEGPVYTFVPQETQQRAMDFLIDYGFMTPDWLLEEDILDRINQSTVVDDMRSAQVQVLNDLTDPQRIARLIEFDARSSEDTYDAFEMMDDVRNGIWSELNSNSAIEVHRRNLQRAYIERMEHLMTEELPDIPDAFKDFLGWTDVNVSQSDIRPIVRDQLQILLDDVQNTQNRVQDRATEAHLDDVEVRIENILNPDE
ncbi:zinc-dependent metalloprotease [Aliifodinibius salipaludis]|uniref:Zinc-dependent metalloprotease n=1 Tax=Fodinibius salipaludis TaxID=2032627 RepID=A0A2A2GC68_9BACT|nr:zinc-dependent metalloprotease [Aliifodinibius salipaludis]PAU94463.1 zinc-dependent metalloprotease [Aliifodinibius salipaludis]